MKINVSNKLFVSDEHKAEQDDISNVYLFDDGDTDKDGYICSLYPSELKNVGWHKLNMLEPFSSVISKSFKEEDMSLKRKHNDDPMSYFKEYTDLKNRYFEEYFKGIIRSDNGQKIEIIDPISFVLYGLNGKHKINKTEVVEKIAQLKCDDFHRPHLVELMNMSSNDTVAISEILAITENLLNKIDKQDLDGNIKDYLRYKTLRLNISNSGESVKRIVSRIMREKGIQYSKNGIYQLLPGEEIIINKNECTSTVKKLNEIRSNRSIEDIYSIMGLMNRAKKVAHDSDLKRIQKNKEIAKWKKKIQDMKNTFMAELLFKKN